MTFGHENLILNCATVSCSCVLKASGARATEETLLSITCVCSTVKVRLPRSCSLLWVSGSLQFFILTLDDLTVAAPPPTPPPPPPPTTQQPPPPPVTTQVPPPPPPQGELIVHIWRAPWCHYACARVFTSVGERWVLVLLRSTSLFFWTVKESD